MNKEFITKKIKGLLLTLRGCARKKIYLYNKFENEELTYEFYSVVQEIKERNSKIIFDSYYMPKAISSILKEEGYLTTFEAAEPRAKAMLLSDLANGILDDFYRFKQV